MTCNPPDTEKLSEQHNCYAEVQTEEMAHERRNGNNTVETNGLDDEQGAVHALAEAYVLIEHVEETIDMDIEELEVAKDSISELQVPLPEEELERARQRLLDGDGDRV
jgi:hypothetical protein